MSFFRQARRECETASYAKMFALEPNVPKQYPDHSALFRVLRQSLCAISIGSMLAADPLPPTPRCGLQVRGQLC